MSLSQKLELWARYATDRQALTTLSLTEPEVISVNEWLTRLERSADFRYAQAPLAKKTCEMLLGLQKAEWKEPFFIQVNANLECCEDRGSMAFNETYIAWVLHSLPTDTPLKERLDLLIGAAKTLALRKELTKLIGNEAESVEIYLYYEIQMKERLKLVTAIEQMQYSRIGKRDHINETALANAVEAHYLNEFIEIPSFQTLVIKDHDYQRLFNENKTHLSIAMDELEAHKEEMSSADYDTENRRHMKERHQLRLTVANAWLSQKLGRLVGQNFEKG